MDYALYQQRVLGRASHRWFNDKVGMENLGYILHNFIKFGNMLDQVKKGLMYGRATGLANGESMPGADKIDDRTQRMIHAMLGSATEGVEMMEAVERFFFAGVPFDEVNLQEEFGDSEWYRALFLDASGQTHEANLEQNDSKLERRFGSTFTVEAANNRNLDDERRILEGGKPGGPGFEDIADDYCGPRC